MTVFLPRLEPYIMQHRSASMAPSPILITSRSSLPEPTRADREPKTALSPIWWGSVTEIQSGLQNLIATHHSFSNGGQLSSHLYEIKVDGFEAGPAVEDPLANLGAQQPHQPTHA